MKHGQGVFTWTSGNIYKGAFVEDERHLQGSMLWTDGSVYEGEWQRGIQHGLGRIIFPDGTVKEGLFENNVYKPGKVTTTNLMNSTNASTGFQADAVNLNQNPYQLNQLNAFANFQQQ